MTGDLRRDSMEPGKGEKVLRIGIIQGGKIIEERRLKKRETVSVGSGPKATFQVSSPTVPKHFELFEFTGTTHYLRFSEGMEGKIQLSGDSVSDFRTIQARGLAVKRGNVSGVELSTESRGKVMLGDVTVLFQFVEAPAAAAKMALPAELRSSFASTIDVQFATIFVAVALSVLGLAAYAQSQPYIEPSTIEELSEKYQRLIMPDRPPELPRDEVAQEKGTEKEKKKEAEDEGKDKAEKTAKAKSKGEKKPVDAEAEARARKEALQKAVAGKGLLGVIGAKGRSDGALSDVFSDGDFGEGKLGDAFSGIQGVDLADGGGARGTRGGGAGGGIAIGDMATAGGGNVSAGGKGAERDVRAEARMEAPEVEGELSADVIKEVMRKNLRAMKDCYERQLKRFPNLQGKIVLSFEIGETGKVSNVDVVEDSVKNAEVKSCIISRARFWRFPAPAGGSVFVSFPLVFAPASN